MEYRKRAYRSYYETHFGMYHTLSVEGYELYRTLYRTRHRDVLPRDKNAKILDVACGTGHHVYFLRKEGYKEARGVDVSAEQIEAARQLGIENLEVADAFEYLRAHPDSFDMIISNDFVEHLSKSEVLNLLDAMYEALRPGGKAVIATINAMWLFGCGTVYCDFTHESGFTDQSLAQVMRMCDFTHVEVHPEKPVVHNVRSAIRAVLWWIMNKLLHTCATIAMGRADSALFHAQKIFEPRIYGVGYKERTASSSGDGESPMS